MAETMMTAPSGDERHSWGALVGWKLEPGGERMQLVMQTVASREAMRDGAIDSQHIMMTQQQAMQLANYLFSVTGQSRPEPRRGPLARLLG